MKYHKLDQSMQKMQKLKSNAGKLLGANQQVRLQKSAATE